MALKLFGDHTSQPFRTVFVFCKINQIPFEFIQVRIGNADQLKQQYTKINPMNKVPAISHNGFNLAQSHAILRYLSKTYQTSENWYPRKNFQKAAKIDQYLDFHHTNTRKCAWLVFNSVFVKTLKKIPPASFVQTQARADVQRVLTTINNVCLHNTPFIYNEQISIADLSAYQELIQLQFLDYDFTKYTRIVQWFKRIEGLKEIQEQNKILNKIVVAIKRAIQNPKL